MSVVENDTMPLVHLNGTSREALIEQHFAVLRAAVALQRALGNANPHSRDYYPKGSNAFKAAQDAHITRVSNVSSITKEMEKIIQHLSVED